MWDIEKRDIAERREKELKETTKYWGNMITKGSRVLRHDNMQQSALALVDSFVKEDSKIILGIQKEMVNDQKPLDKTEAGQDIKSMLDEQHASLRTEIHTVESDLREALRAKDEELAQVMSELRLEHKQALQQVLDNQQRLQATMQQLHETKSAELEAKLEEERQKWRSQIPPQIPNGVPVSSSTNAQQLAGEHYRDPELPSSAEPPGNPQLVHQFERDTLGKINECYIQVSPDGSCFALCNHWRKQTTVLVATDTGTQLEQYASPLRTIGFSSDGDVLALWDGKFLHKATLDRSSGRRHPQQWRKLNIRNSWIPISEDSETVVDILEGGLALTSLATEESHKLKWTTQNPEVDATRLNFLFAKHSELLACVGPERIYFFDTKTRTCLMAQPVPGLVGEQYYRSTISGDTLSLCVIVPPPDGTEHKTFVSFFRLSGVRPELMSTFRYKINPTTINNWNYIPVSLSFDGRYAAFPNTDSRIDIVHTMSGRRVLSQEVEGGLLELSFFPSDDRFMWLTKKGSYHVARLVDEG